MAFEPTPTATPTSIGEMTIVLKDLDGTNPNRSIRAEVQILDQDGEVQRLWRGDVQPHLTSAQINTLIGFLDDLRTQAETELLP